MTTRKRRIDVTVDEVRRALERILAGADAARAAALAGLGRLRAAKSASLAREQARLTARYGAEDERTRAVARRTETNRVLVHRVAAEAARAAIQTPAPNPHGWILHGRVLDAQLQGVPSLTVALYDERGTWLHETGHAYTDKTGHFLLSVKSDRAATAPKDEKDAKPAPVFLHVLDAKGATLHKGTEPLAPTLGRVDFRQIVLGEQPAQGTPPDGDKRGASRPDAAPASDGPPTPEPR